MTSLGVRPVGKQLDVKWRNWGNGQKSRSGNKSCKDELIIDRGDPELRNVNFSTQSRSFNSNFTPRKTRKSQQIEHIDSTKLR